MVERKKWDVEYSTQSLKNAQEIVFYLGKKFSQKEIDKFYRSLEDFEKIICLYPTLYPESTKHRIRRAVLSRVLSVYYTLKPDRITVVAILDNRWEEEHRI